VFEVGSLDNNMCTNTKFSDSKICSAFINVSYVSFYMLKVCLGLGLVDEIILLLSLLL